MNIMEVVVGRHPGRVWIIGRILDRCEVFGFMVFRNDDDAAWMLAGGALNVLTVRRQIFLHRPAHRDIHLLTIA